MQKLLKLCIASLIYLFIVIAAVSAFLFTLLTLSVVAMWALTSNSILFIRLPDWVFFLWVCGLFAVSMIPYYAVLFGADKLITELKQARRERKPKKPGLNL